MNRIERNRNLSEIGLISSIDALDRSSDNITADEERISAGVKQPLAMHHRVSMIFVAFVSIYFGLWVLHLLYAAKHYVFLVIALIVLLLVVGVRASRLLKVAVLSPSSSRIEE